MNNILIAIDFSPVSDEVIRVGAELARSTGSKLWVLHVAAPEPDFVGFGVGPTYIREFRAGELHEEHSKLQTFASTLRESGVNAEALLIQGPTTEAILDEGDRLSADLIIVGKHSRGLMSKVFTGSVSTALVKKSHKPILIIPGIA